MTKSLAFKGPWVALEEDRGLVKELRREICRRHPLHGVPLKAVAMDEEADDDFLFAFEDGSGRFAFVHLTWQKERDPKWPFTVIYESFEAFQEA